MEISQITSICQALVRSDLTPAKVVILQKCRMGAYMTEIAGMLGHSTAAATGSVDYLERAGMVRREHDLDDRRKIKVTTLPDGFSALEKMMELVNEEIAA